MEIWAAAVAVVGVGAGVYGTIQASNAANASASTSTAVADYNARVDRSAAEQIGLDTEANIKAMRKDNAGFMSRQTAAFTASGIRSDTGSPLVLRAMTAGSLAMKEQQVFTESEVKQRRLDSSARAGVAEGAAQADAYHAQGVAAVLSGAGRVASMLGQDYQNGLFSGTKTNNLSAGLSTGSPAGATDLPSMGGYA